MRSNIDNSLSLYSCSWRLDIVQFQLLHISSNKKGGFHYNRYVNQSYDQNLLRMRLVEDFEKSESFGDLRLTADLSSKLRSFDACLRLNTLKNIQTRYSKLFSNAVITSLPESVTRTVSSILMPMFLETIAGSHEITMFGDNRPLFNAILTKNYRVKAITPRNFS
jgi:hypothetical protein